MHHALWQSVLGEIEVSISHAAFTTWFKNTELIDISNNVVSIAVPNIFAKRQFEVKFNDQIKGVLDKNGVQADRIIYTVQVTGKKTISRETTAAPALTDQVNDLISAPAMSTASSPHRGPNSTGSGLNPRYTFDNFIVGSSNDLAYTACQAVAAHPGTKYNPLFRCLRL